MFRCPTEGCDNIHSYPTDIRKNKKCGKCKQSINLQVQVGTLNSCEELYKKGAELMEVCNFYDIKYSKIIQFFLILLKTERRR